MSTYKIYLSVQITRRKYYHLIEDPNGNIVWRGKKISDAIDWIYDMGKSELVLESGERTYEITLHPQLRVKGT